MTISPAHSGTMVHESGEIWTAEALLEPIRPKSVRLLQSIESSPCLHDTFGMIGIDITKSKMPGEILPDSCEEFLWLSFCDTDVEH